MTKKEIYNLPLRLESEGNNFEHWTKKYKRKKIQASAIRFKIQNTEIKPPCIVTLTRVAPRALDEHDNLRIAFKLTVDTISDILIPGLQAGRADSSDKIKWKFKQEKGGVREYALIIELQEDNYVYDE